MKKLFASVPMRGRTEEEIRESFAKMKRIAEAYVLRSVHNGVTEKRTREVERIRRKRWIKRK